MVYAGEVGDRMSSVGNTLSSRVTVTRRISVQTPRTPYMHARQKACLDCQTPPIIQGLSAYILFVGPPENDLISDLKTYVMECGSVVWDKAPAQTSMQTAPI